MAVAAKFTCPDDQETFGLLWSFGRPVTCPQCGKKWATEVVTNDDGDVTGARIAGPVPAPEPQ